MQTPLVRFVVVPKCCGLVVQFVSLTDLLASISTILATHYDISDVLAACRTVNVAPAVATSYLHHGATVSAYTSSKPNS